jgi:hypothetical protein
MAALLAELHAAEAARVLAGPERPCALCGVSVHVAAAPGDEWRAADASGSFSGADPDLAHLFDPAANWLGASNPYDYLARLSRALDGADPLSKRTETTWLYERTIREYASLKVRLDVGMTFHQHRIASDWDGAAFAAAWAPGMMHVRRAGVPYHHDRIAWCRPSGWECRECRATLTDETPGLWVRA